MRLAMPDMRASPETSLPALRDLIDTHDLTAKKSLGQHFLLDLNITRKIARCAHATSDDLIIEVGPGPGGLTRALLETGAHVIAIEKDTRCITALEELHPFFPGQLTICTADAMRIDEELLIKSHHKSNRAHQAIKLVSNLPYNISTALLVKWLVVEDPFWQSLTLMFQKEVAQRILAPPGSKAYGRLSVIAQAAARPKPGFDLPARAFTPPPKVHSAIVHFTRPKKRSLPLKSLEKITAAAFSQRRKMLRTSLKNVFKEQTNIALETVGITPTARAEEIDVSGFIALARHLNEIDCP